MAAVCGAGEERDFECVWEERAETWEGLMGGGEVAVVVGECGVGGHGVRREPRLDGEGVVGRGVVVGVGRTGGGGGGVGGGSSGIGLPVDGPEACVVDASGVDC